MSNVTHSAISGTNLHAPNFAVVAPGSTLGTFDTGAGYQLSLANSNGVTFGLSNSTLTASVAAAGTVSAGAASVALAANSLVFSNSNGVSFGLNGSTMTASAVAVNVTGDYMEIGNGPGASAAAINVGQLPLSASQLGFCKIPGPGYGKRWPFDITAKTILAEFFFTGSTATASQQFSSSFSLGIYTLNGSVLSLLNSCSVSFGYGAAATDNSSQFNGGSRFLSIHSSLWSSSPVFTQGGDYWLASIWNFSSVSLQSNTQLGIFPYNAGTRSGTIGGSASGQTVGQAPFIGLYSAGTTAFPATVANTQLQKMSGNFLGFTPNLVLANNTNLTVF